MNSPNFSLSHLREQPVRERVKEYVCSIEFWLQAATPDEKIISARRTDVICTHVSRRPPPWCAWANFGPIGCIRNSTCGDATRENSHHSNAKARSVFINWISRLASPPPRREKRAIARAGRIINFQSTPAKPFRNTSTVDLCSYKCALIELKRCWGEYERLSMRRAHYLSGFDSAV